MKKKLIVITITSFLILKIGIPFLAADTHGETGTIHGKVLLDADVPALPQILIDKSVDFCGKTVVDPILKIQNQGIQGAVVSIDWDAEVLTDDPPDPVFLRSQHCLFQPRIQATRIGAFLTLNSGDEIAHNPHGWWNDTKTVFNITLLNPNLKFKRKLKWEGTYRVECDTHTWMKSYILVFNHPFYTVTNAKGVFMLDKVPVGKHTLRVWHEILGEQTAMVIVMPGKKTQANFSLSLIDHRHQALKPKTVAPWPPGNSPPEKPNH